MTLLRLLTQQTVERSNLVVNALCSPICRSARAARTSMIPIHLTENEVQDVIDGKAKYTLRLHVENTGQDALFATSSDFTGTINGQPLSNEKIQDLLDPIPIASLRPGTDSLKVGDVMELACTLHVGTGRIPYIVINM